MHKRVCVAFIIFGIIVSIFGPMIFNIHRFIQIGIFLIGVMIIVFSAIIYFNEEDSRYIKSDFKRSPIKSNRKLKTDDRVRINYRGQEGYIIDSQDGRYLVRLPDGRAESYSEDELTKLSGL